MSTPNYTWKCPEYGAGHTPPDDGVFTPVNSHNLRGSGPTFSEDGGVNFTRDSGDTRIHCSRDRKFFMWLKQQYDDGSCDEFSITQEKECATGIIYEGKFKIQDIRWNFNKCECTIKPTHTDANDCLRKGFRKEVNMFDMVPFADRITIETIENFFDSAIVNSTEVQFTHTISPAVPSGSGWLDLTPTIIGSNATDQGTLLVWVRPLVFVECNGGVVENPPTGLGGAAGVVVDACANGIASYTFVYAGATATLFLNQMETAFAPIATPDIAALHKFEGITDGGDQLYLIPVVFPDDTTDIDNGILLTDLILSMATDACASVTDLVSDLLLTAEEEEYITGGVNHWRRLVIMDITDVKYWDAAENATRNIITLEKILKILNEVFNLYWRVEDGDTLRIEHISYWKNLYADIQDFSALHGYEVVQFEKDAIVKKHIFNFLVQRNTDFVGLPITYPEDSCLSKDEKTVNTIIATDIMFVLNNPDSVPDDGLFLFAASDSGNSRTTNGKITGALIPNGPMGWAHIHTVFHLHERSAEDVYINGELVTALSVKARREQEIRYRDKCLKTNFAKRITTRLGTGDITDWSYDESSEFITVKILF